MPARVPQDVDLEDKLVFGLSPLRFGYVVIGIIIGAGVWAVHWPMPLPLLAALPIGTGATLAVGRWRGHPLDSLAWDVATHLIRNYRVELSQDLKALLRLANRQRKASRPGRVVTVTALDAFNNVASGPNGYGGTVHFSSSDGTASLHTDYTFTPLDNGVHTFLDGVTLHIAAIDSITVSDAVNVLSDSKNVSVHSAPSASITLAGLPGEREGPLLG